MPTLTESDRITRARRPGAAAFASLLLAAQLASAAHLLVVRHAVCSLDGELIHPDERAGHAHAAPRALERPGIDSSGPQEAAHGHDHCVLASRRRDPAAVPAPAGLSLEQPRIAVAPRPVAAGQGAQRLELYRLAPKQSPPA